MAFILGSKDNFNRDPKKMGRFWNNAQGGLVIPMNNTGINQHYTVFGSTKLWSTYTTASAIVANQSYTIYNVSGASGFLIHAFTNTSSGNGANTVTYTVTVDGVVSTIDFPQSSTTESMSAWLGQIAGGQYDLDNFASSGPSNFTQGTMIISSGQTVGSRILSNKVIDYAMGDGNEFGCMFPQDLDAPISNPLSCTRFENSLTVAYTTTVALASSENVTRRSYGALVKIDD